MSASMPRGGIQFGSRRIPYRLSKTGRRKTVAIAVDPTLGVLVRAPATLLTEELAGILHRKAPWIWERLRRVRELPRPARREFVSGESFPYLGRNYRLKLIRGDGRIRAALSGRRLYVAGASSAPAIRETLRQWYGRRAARRLPERVALWARRLGVPTPPVIIRDQSKRWGSCDVRRRLRLNWRIVMAPMSLIDYVVVHEVCHLVRPHHGREFWKLIRRLLPDWERRRDRLREEGRRFSL